MKFTAFISFSPLLILHSLCEEFKGIKMHSKSSPLNNFYGQNVICSIPMCSLILCDSVLSQQSADVLLRSTANRSHKIGPYTIISS